MTREELKQAAWEYYLNLDNHHSKEKQHNNIYTNAFEAGAEWEHKRLVEKACEWLRKNTTWECNFYGGTNPNKNKIEEFRKAMEE